MLWWLGTDVAVTVTFVANHGVTRVNLPISVTFICSRSLGPASTCECSLRRCCLARMGGSACHEFIPWSWCELIGGEQSLWSMVRM